jgi:hypothetical protein
MVIKNHLTHIDPKENLYLLFGQYPVYTVDLNNRQDISDIMQLNLKNDEKIILEVKLNTISEAMYRMLGKTVIKGVQANSLTDFIHLLGQKGYTVIQNVVVMPNIKSARFYFPYDDYCSHKYLLFNFLLPRKYSLTLPLRFLLYIYLFILRIRFLSFVLYRYSYIFLKKNESADTNR